MNEIDFRQFHGLSRVPGQMKKTQYRPDDAMWILFMHDGKKYYCPALQGPEKPAKKAFKRQRQALDYRVAVLTKYIHLRDAEATMPWPWRFKRWLRRKISR